MISNLRLVLTHITLMFKKNHQQIYILYNILFILFLFVLYICIQNFENCIKNKIIEYLVRKFENIINSNKILIKPQYELNFSLVNFIYFIYMKLKEKQERIN